MEVHYLDLAKKALDSFLQNDENSHEYRFSDEENIRPWILALSSQAILDGKHIHINCHAEKHRELLLLLKEAFPNILYIQNESKALSASLSKWMNTPVSESISEEYIDYQLQKELHQSTEAEIQEIYGKIYSKNTNPGVSLQKGAIKMALDPMDISLLSTRVLDKKDLLKLQHELPALLIEIEMAAGLYSKNLDFKNIKADKTEIVNFSQKNIDHAEHLKSVLYEYMQKMYECKKTWLSFIDNITGQWLSLWKTELSSFDQEMSAIKKLKSAYIIRYGADTAQKPGLLNFSQEQKKQYEEWETLLDGYEEFQESYIEFFSKNGITKSEYPMPDSIESFGLIEDIFTQFSNEYITVLESKAREKIKQINCLNTQASELKVIYDFLVEYCKEINALSVFHKRPELNSQSAIKIYDFILNSIYTIEQGIYELEHEPEYYKWKSFLNQSSEIFRKVFPELKIMPRSKWKNAMLYWYHEKLIELHDSKNTIDISWWKDKLMKSESSLRLKTGTVLEDFTKLSFKKTVQNMEKSSAKEWTKMLSAKNGTIYHADIVDHQLKRAFEAAHPLFVSLHQEQNIKFVVKDASSGQILKTCLFVAYDTSKTLTGEEGKETAILAAPPQYNFAHTMGSMHYADKLKAAEQLADLMMMTEMDFRLFISKSAIIISGLSSDIHDEIKNRLHKSGLKEFTQSHKTREGLTEFFMETSKKPILFTENGLIDSSRYQDFLKQYYIICQLTKAGFDTFDLSLYRLFIDKQEALTSVFSSINPLHDYTEKASDAHPAVSTHKV
jgi:hypothetical protein